MAGRSWAGALSPASGTADKRCRKREGADAGHRSQGDAESRLADPSLVSLPEWFSKELRRSHFPAVWLVLTAGQ